MSKDAKPTQQGIDQFHSGPGARADHWSDLVDASSITLRVSQT
jgi:hypothetical protein